MTTAKDADVEHAGTGSPTASDGSRDATRDQSLHAALGGDEAIAMALDRFYEKVLADPRVSGYFDGLDVERIKTRQREFLAMAFGGPARYRGRDLRTAHRRARERGLDEAGYDVFMGHFRATLEELGVDAGRVGEVMAIADTGKDDVLGR